MGVNLGVIQKSGSWLSYNGERIGQGKDNARKTIEQDAALFAELEEKVRAACLKAIEGGAMQENEEGEDFELDDDDLDIELLGSSDSEN